MNREHFQLNSIGEGSEMKYNIIEKSGMNLYWNNLEIIKKYV